MPFGLNKDICNVQTMVSMTSQQNTVPYLALNKSKFESFVKIIIFSCIATNIIAWSCFKSSSDSNHFIWEINVGKSLIRNRTTPKLNYWTQNRLKKASFKGSSDQSHFIFEINVGKSRIRHRSTLKLNDEFLDRLKIDCGWRYSNSESLHVESASFRHWFQKLNSLSLDYR